MGLGKGYPQGVLTKSANAHRKQNAAQWGAVTSDTERYQQFEADCETLRNLFPETAASLNWYKPWRDLHDEIAGILDAHAGLVEAINDTDRLVDSDCRPLVAAAAQIEEDARAALLAQMENHNDR